MLWNGRWNRGGKFALCFGRRAERQKRLMLCSGFDVRIGGKDHRRSLAVEQFRIGCWRERAHWDQATAAIIGRA
jgi:hypothetical protein